MLWLIWLSNYNFLNNDIFKSFSGLFVNVFLLFKNFNKKPTVIVDNFYLIVIVYFAYLIVLATWHNWIKVGSRDAYDKINNIEATVQPKLKSFCNQIKKFFKE